MSFSINREEGKAFKVPKGPVLIGLRLELSLSIRIELKGVFFCGHPVVKIFFDFFLFTDLVDRGYFV